MGVFMKKTIISLLLCIILYAQELRVTDMNGYSVEAPKMAISNGYVHLTYATNYRYYKFPVTGPTSPISNPIYLYPNQWGPYCVSISAFNNNVYSSCIDWVHTGYNYYTFFSTNGGNNWPTQIFIDTVEQINWLSLRKDLPNIVVDNNGNFYHLWYIFKNQGGTGKLMFSNDAGITRKEIGDTNSEEAVSIYARKINEQNYVAIVYYSSQIGKVYCVLSSDGGQTFSQPYEILRFDNDNGFTNVEKSWVKIMPNGDIYAAISYLQMQFGNNDPNHEWMGGTFIYKSTDLGNNWDYFAQIDTIYEFYHTVFDMKDDGTIVKLFTDGLNFQIGSSKDGINWNKTDNQVSRDSLYPNSFNMQFVDNKAAVAWIDNRTGHDEIYYKLIDIPSPPLVAIENNLLKNRYDITIKNYPNPFNPTTKIVYQIPVNSYLKIVLYDNLGKQIKTLYEGFQLKGEYNIDFNASNLATGVYFVEINNTLQRKTHKILYLK